jgi:hypothetical protein
VTLVSMTVGVMCSTYRLREKCRVSLTYRGSKIIAVEPGVAFDSSEWDRICAEIEGPIGRRSGLGLLDHGCASRRAGVSARPGDNQREALGQFVANGA